MKKIGLISCILIGICFFAIYHITKKPTVSVIMSTYNRAKLLPTAIDTILNQTFKDFEFIIINDGSSDKTAYVLSEYAKKDKRIKVITNSQNIGLIDSLNKGLDIAKGKYIARMDDDDKSVPTRFQHQVAYMEKNKDVVVTGTAQGAIYEDFFVPVEKVTVDADADELSIVAHYNVPILHPSAMIRSDFIKKHNIRYGKEYPSAEDTPFWFDIVKKGGKIVRLTPPLVVSPINAPKKSNYYNQQFHSYVKFVNNTLKDVIKPYKINNWLKNNEICFILQQLKNNPKPHYTNKSIEKLQKEKSCLSHYKIFNLYGYNIIVGADKNNNYLISNIPFKLENETKNMLVLTHGETHLELKEENGIYHIAHQKNILNLRHPDWIDYAIITDKKVHFILDSREAQLVSFDNGTLKIHFEKWGEESFKKESENTYNFQKK